MKINEIKIMNIGSVKSLSPYVAKSDLFDILSILYIFNGRLSSPTIIVNGN